MFPRELETVTKQTNPGCDHVKQSIMRPEGQDDTWMYVQRDAKRKKETSIAGKLTQRFEEELHNLDGALSKKGGTQKLEKVRERIGRAKEKHRKTSAHFTVEVAHNNKEVATKVSWKRKISSSPKEKEKGVYFLNNSFTNLGEGQLWDIYNTIREVESTFWCLKSELQKRPIPTRMTPASSLTST